MSGHRPEAATVRALHTQGLEIPPYSTVDSDQNALMDSERLEAIGPRGKACIIVTRRSAQPDGQVVSTYMLASGERLRPTDAPSEYSALDGSRTFRLRQQ